VVAQRTVRIRAAVLIWRDGGVLLVRHEKAGHTYWLVPGGGVDPGETMVDAGARELREETGYDVEVNRLVLICEAIDPNPGGRHIVNTVYSGRILAGSLSVGVGDKALREAKWLPIAALTTLEMYPPIGHHLRDVIDENGQGAVRVLGNTWRSWDAPGE
jgi:8-oxo-dGTP diphosphatase